jgi:hypothetical protein
MSVKKYSQISQIKKIKVLRSTQHETYCAEIIQKPYENVSEHKHDELLREVHDLAKRGWGDFDYDYLEKNVLESYLLCLLRNDRGNLVGMAPIKRVKVLGRTIYSFGLSIVDPDFRGLSLLTRMSTVLVRRIFAENIIRGRGRIEFVFITPNIRTMGAIARAANFIYPNPYDFDEKTKTIPRADDETWETVKEYLKVTKEKYRKLDRNGCVMEGFYDNRPHLIVKGRDHIDKKLHDFGEKYLYATPGREIVVRAKIDLMGVLKNGN